MPKKVRPKKKTTKKSGKDHFMFGVGLCRDCNEPADMHGYTPHKCSGDEEPSEKKQ